MVDNVSDRGSPLPEVDDEAEGDCDDLRRTQVNDVTEAGDDEVCEFREGGVVFSEFNPLIGHATENDDTNDDLAGDEGQRDPELRVLRCLSVSNEVEGYRSVCFYFGGRRGFGEKQAKCLCLQCTKDF